ncbi:hypothetical protein KEM54_000248, partial [Ascosphaera aggregata]
YIENHAPESQWIANTSDKILSSKADLYDVIIDLPPEYAINAPGRKAYPKLRVLADSAALSTGERPTDGETVVKATQRDARRYMNLKKGLQRQYLAARVGSQVSTTNDIRGQVNLEVEEMESLSPSSFSEIVEPTSWSALAYSSFMWWASAGEKSAEYEFSQESEADARMLYTAINRLTETVDMTNQDYRHRHHDDDDDDDNNNNSTYNGDEEDIDQDIFLPTEVEAAATDGSTGRRRRAGGYRRVIHRQPWEITLIAYFRSFTARIFTVLNDIILRSDSEADKDGTESTTAYEDQDVSSTTDPGSYTESATRFTPTSSEAENDDDGGYDEDEPLLAGGRLQDEPVTITHTDITRMGLDPSSGFDRAFVQELVKVWWARKAVVKGDGITCCGFRVL